MKRLFGVRPRVAELATVMRKGRVTVPRRERAPIRPSWPGGSAVTELWRRAERETRAATVPAVTVRELRTLVEQLGDLVRVLEQADPAKKAELYERLGLNLVYHPQDRRVTVEADLAMCRVGVGGPTG